MPVNFKMDDRMRLSEVHRKRISDSIKNLWTTDEYRKKQKRIRQTKKEEREYKKNYNINHRKEISEYNKKYYQRNKEHLQKNREIKPTNI